MPEKNDMIYLKVENNRLNHLVDAIILDMKDNMKKIVQHKNEPDKVLFFCGHTVKALELIQVLHEKVRKQQQDKEGGIT